MWLLLYVRKLKLVSVCFLKIIVVNLIYYWVNCLVDIELCNDWIIIIKDYLNVFVIIFYFLF